MKKLLIAAAVSFVCSTGVIGIANAQTGSDNTGSLADPG